MPERLSSVVRNVFKKGDPVAANSATSTPMSVNISLGNGGHESPLALTVTALPPVNQPGTPSTPQGLSLTVTLDNPNVSSGCSIRSSTPKLTIQTPSIRTEICDERPSRSPDTTLLQATNDPNSLRDRQKRQGSPNRSIHVSLSDSGFGPSPKDLNRPLPPTPDTFIQDPLLNFSPIYPPPPASALGLNVPANQRSPKPNSGGMEFPEVIVLPLATVSGEPVHSPTSPMRSSAPPAQRPEAPYNGAPKEFEGKVRAVHDRDNNQLVIELKEMEPVHNDGSSKDPRVASTHNVVSGGDSSRSRSKGKGKDRAVNDDLDTNSQAKVSSKLAEQRKNTNSSSIKSPQPKRDGHIEGSSGSPRAHPSPVAAQSEKHIAASVKPSGRPSIIIKEVASTSGSDLSRSTSVRYSKGAYGWPSKDIDSDSSVSYLQPTRARSNSLSPKPAPSNLDKSSPNAALQPSLKMSRDVKSSDSSDIDVRRSRRSSFQSIHCSMTVKSRQDNGPIRKDTARDLSAAMKDLSDRLADMAEEFDRQYSTVRRSKGSSTTRHTSS